MFKAFIEFLRAMKTSMGRLRLAYFFFRNIPGEYGILLRKWLLKKHFEDAGENLRIHEGVRFRNIHKIRVGTNVGIGDDSFLQAGGGLEMGNNVVLGPGVKIWTQNHRFEDPEVPVRDQGAEYHKVVIEDDVWIGAGAFIMPGAHLTRGCVVSACAVVAGRRYKEYSILAGNPARVIRFRKIPKMKSESTEHIEE